MTNAAPTVLKNLFDRPIDRPINGVIKADQNDDATVWQELDEFVITRELNKHLGAFISAYVAGLSPASGAQAAAGMGVWMAGFFGSGKSHFLKVLAHLLRNHQHTHDGKSRSAFEFFESKVADAMLLGDIKRAVAPSTDVILFNIDAKADADSGRDAILKVFLKVLNELQGFSTDHPHIAHLERHLQEKGQLDTFHAKFKEASGSPWLEQRDAYALHRDEVVAAFRAATGQSESSAEKWIDNAADHFEITVEKFAGWTRDYLDTQGPDHRLLFFVDEIGQFIGGDTHLMLNLQTVTEQLGTACDGRAWVVVTSQEDIDAVVKGVTTAKSNDFSKIQGRFRTKLKLTSANVDEVIQARLLTKTPAATTLLTGRWEKDHDVLRQQVELPDATKLFKSYVNAEDFVKNYPFIPYQFTLLQKVFESIRKVGASGQHLAQGERSILDAVQVAGCDLADRPVGALVPMHAFYPAIEGFLESAVGRTIIQAGDNPAFAGHPEDLHLLQTLFLIRYVDEVKGTLANLVTLSVEEIDQNRIALKTRIQASLDRLEKESLVKRTGNEYVFLTNEERDITREIKNVQLDTGEALRFFAGQMFDEVLGPLKKHRHTASKLDFEINRLADGVPHGAQREDGLVLHIISPLSPDREAYDGAGRGLLESSNDGGVIIAVLPANDRLARDLRSCLQTGKYLKRKSDGSNAEDTKRILRDINEENQDRTRQLTHLLSADFANARWFVASQSFEPRGTGAPTRTGDALDRLVESTFTKRGLLAKVLDESSAKQETQSVLRSNDAERQHTLLQLEEANPRAIVELQSRIELMDDRNEQIVLAQLMATFEARPYAWPDHNLALLIARLLVAGKITLHKDGGTVPTDQAYGVLFDTKARKATSINKRKTANPALIRKATKRGKAFFGVNLPDDELKLAEALRDRLQQWETRLRSWQTLASTGNYPGGDLITDTLNTLAPLVRDEDAARLIERFANNDDALEEADQAIHKLGSFYDSQRPAWESLRNALQSFDANAYNIEQDPAARNALTRLRAIANNPAPYDVLHQAAADITAVQKIADALVTAARAAALEAIAAKQAVLTQDLATAKADDAVKTAALDPLGRLQKAAAGEVVLAQLREYPERAADKLAQGQQILQDALAKAVADSPAATAKPVLKPVATVRVSQLAVPGYVETQAQADAVVSKLAEKLAAELKAGNRIDLR